MLLAESGDRLLWFPSVGVDSIIASGHQWRGGSRGASLGGTYAAPFPTKVRLALANSWRKVRTRSDCCGNYGEPGC